MKKKVLSMLLVLILAFSLSGNITYAAGDGTLTVNAGNITNGKVAVSIDYTGNPGIAGMAFALEFDKTKVTPSSYTKGTVLGGTPLSNLDQPGLDWSSLDEVTFQWSSFTDVKNDGTLLTIIFDVHSGDWEETELAITYNPGDIANQNLDDVAPSVINDSVSLPEFDYIFSDATKTYNGSVQKLVATGLNGATVTYENNENKNAGTYEVRAIARKAGYRTNIKTATLIIKPKELTVTGLKAENKSYDSTPVAVLTGGVLNGIVTGDDVSAVMPTNGIFTDADAGNNISVSFDEIVLSGTAKNNYTLTQPTGLKADITKAPVTVTADGKQKREGTDDPVLTYQYTGTLYGEDSFIGSLQRTAGETIGVYDITQGDLTLGNNYAITFIKGTFEIVDKTPQNIILDEIPTKTYGDVAFDLMVTPDSTSNLSDFTFDSSDESVAMVDETGKVTIVGAGETILSVTEPGNEEYAKATVTQKLVVDKKALEIKVDPVAITYGDVINTNITYTGFVDGEDEDVLTKDVTISGYPAKPGVGEYNIILNGVEADNYQISYVNAKLTVNQKNVTITELKVFDKAADTTTAAIINGSSLVLDGAIAGDDVTIDLSKATATFATAEIGESIAVTITDIELIGDASANYNLTHLTFTTVASIRENITADDIVTQITAMSIVKDATAVVLPNVPTGYQITLKSSDNESVIDLDGNVAPVETDTQVGLVLTVTSETDESDTADTLLINVTVPASSRVTVIVVTDSNGRVSGGGEYLKNSEVTLVAVPNSGYSFVGWHEGDTVVSTESNYTFTAVSDVELTAKFNKRTASRRSGGGFTHTVKFETNGGTKVPNKTSNGNVTITEPKAPTKEGFSFAGWYTDKELTKAYDFSTKVSKSFTLYAKWEEIEGVKVDDNQIILTIGKKEASVFGETKVNDVAPVIKADRTMFPARFIAENMGALVTWTEVEPNKVLITKGNIEILIYIGENIAYVNGEAVTLDSPAFIENERTYTPVRLIAESLGGTVEWIAETATVIITV